MQTLKDLREGESGTIVSLEDETSAPKLLEMGFVPGTKVQLYKKAPLGCPLCFVFDDQYRVSLRSSDAASVVLEQVRFSLPQKNSNA